MTTLGRRLAGLLVVPASEVEKPPPADVDPAACAGIRGPVVVIVGPDWVDVVARDIAGGLAREHRRAALVLTWAADPAGLRRHVASRSAVRAAERLVGRGHSALAIGRIADVPVDCDERRGVPELQRVLADWREGPVVVALCGPRGHGFDAVLGTADLAVVATQTGSPSALGQAALLGVQDLAPAVCAVALRRGGWLARWRNRAAVATVLAALP